MDRSKVPLLSGGSEKRAPEGKIGASKRHSPVEVMCGNSLKMGQNPTGDSPRNPLVSPDHLTQIQSDVRLNELLLDSAARGSVRTFGAVGRLPHQPSRQVDA